MSEPATKKQYWCMFCSYRGWYEAKGEEFKSCPRCGNGMFVWEGSRDMTDTFTDSARERGART